jgi:glycosyltransferase involved in cell wall biosynthesis
VPRAVARADWVLADSHSTQHDLVELLNAPPDRTGVVYPGVESRFVPVEDGELLQHVRAKYALPERFILSLGTVQPRKNYTGLMKAFSRLAVRDLALVIVGGRGWLADRIYRAPQELGLGEQVRFLGFVDDKDLPAVYSMAELFAMPSLYEGFGLPLLEAMACGVPVLAAANSSLPEVVGEAGILIDTLDVDAWTGAMEHILTHPHQRAEYVERGRAQAHRFPWRSSAEQLLAVYRQLGAA